MKLNDRLHLIVPIYDDDEKVSAYVYSAPISREVFEAHFLLVSKTFAAIHADGLGEVAGPRVASMILTEVAKRQRDVEGAATLRNEIHRLTNVLVPGANGWETIPYDDAIKTGAVSDEDLSEVENALVFFIVVSAMHRRQVLRVMLPGAASLWGAQTSLLDCSGFGATLRTSTVTANIGAKKAPASSVPS